MCGILRVVLLAAGVSVLGGCAASNNLFEKGGCKVYGGTRTDATLIADGFSTDSELSQDSRIERPVQVWSGFCGLVDLPLSFVADTVMLPITVPVTVARAHDQPKSTPRRQARQDDEEAEEAEDE